MMGDPNPDDPLTPDAANLYKSDPDLYFERAQTYTTYYAMDF